MSINVAIDGPGGAGKSTIAKLVAKKKNFVYVDTGAMYRAMGIYFSRKGIAPDDMEGIAREAEGAVITIAYENGSQQVYLNGENVTGELRTEAAGRNASAFSVHGPVRKKLVELQKELARTTDVVMDGRDIGTVVLPEADVKVFLTASAAARAKRRFLELSEKGVPCNLSDIEKELEERDYRDTHRENSPLRQAEDAVLIDSSDLSIQEVTDRILSLIDEV